MKISAPTQPPERRDRLLREQVHDTYKRRGQLKEPARCPGCGAVYRKGRQIGKAIHDAWKGELNIHFDEGGYFTRISWRREE